MMTEKKSWFDEHVVVIGLSDDMNAAIKSKLKDKLVQTLKHHPQMHNSTRGFKNRRHKSGHKTEG